MKKILLTILAVFFILSVTGVAMAGGPKPPKSIGLLLINGGSNDAAFFCITTKKNSSMKLGSLKVSLYAIQGAFKAPTPSGLFPCTGSGYMLGSLFYFTIHSVTNGAQYAMQGTWDVELEIGTIFTVNSGATNSVTEYEDDLVVINCEEDI